MSFEGKVDSAFGSSHQSNKVGLETSRSYHLQILYLVQYPTDLIRQYVPDNCLFLSLELGLQERECMNSNDMLNPDKYPGPVLGLTSIALYK